MKEEKVEKPQYWLVGANWGGKDKTSGFVRNSCWKMGYDDDDKKGLAALRKTIKKGDRIAIKARCGRGSDQIRIKAIGIVLGQDQAKNGLVFVDWKVTGMDRLVDAHGVFAVLHGPYFADDPNHGDWIRDTFVL